MPITRRHLLAVSAAVAARAQNRKRWEPKLGILGRYSPKNLAFARQAGCSSVQFMSDGQTLNAMRVDDRRLEAVKAEVAQAGLYLSSVGDTVNHIAPEPEARARAIARFSKVIEMTGKLGAPYAATASGTMPGKPLREQVDQIVRVYTESYFPLCQKYNVKILWEPWAGGPNIATGPVGYEALFKAFNNSPYVGLQFDPSHLQWQMMDPIQCARDFVDKIWDVHLKDVEIMWPVLRRTGINPLTRERWWRFRLPGSGMVDWKGLFTVLADAGYRGAMNIENEDNFYYPAYERDSADFTPQFRRGFEVALRYLRQYVPA
ncbi:MAG: sugar phosphate isomerase/epimerase [Acidobacteria bacterium]|nr:sugar phosphate isomerase/epimerase [Acidobacteriota bacterium]